MSEFPSLAEVLAKHQRLDAGDGWIVCLCEIHLNISASREVVNDRTYVEHFERRWREACTITTVEQLDSLPAKSAIQSDAAATGDGNPWTWERFDEGWFTTAFDPAGVPDLPALLLRHPGWSKP